MFVIPIVLAFAAMQCEASLQNATVALQQNDLQKADSILKSSAAECGGVSSFYALRGVTDELSNRTENAEAAFLKAISLDPRTVRFKEQLGAVYLRNKKPQQAVQILREAATLDPANPAVKKYLIAAYAETDAWSEAVPLFSQLGEKLSASSDPALLLWFARALIETHQLARLDREFPASSVEMKPSLLFSLGTLFAQHGLFQRAVEFFTQIPERDADDAVCFNLGLAYSHLQRFSEARRSYFLAIDKHLENVDAYFRVGLDYGAEGNGRYALPWLFRAHQWAATRSDISYALIEQLIQLEYLDTAAATLAQAVSGDPLLATAAADLQLGRGDAEGARRGYEALIKQHAGFAPALIGLARADIAQHKDAEAKSTLLSVLTRNATDATALGELGGVEARLGNWEGASKNLRSAWMQDRSNPRIALQLSRAELHLGRAAEALKVLTAIEPSMQRSPVYHRELANAYTKLQQPAKAAEQRERAAELEVESQEGLHFDNPKTYVH